MANVVVFGATGWAGGHIVRELDKRGHSVTRVTRSGAVGTAQGDLTDRDSVREALEGADVAVVAIRAYQDGENVLAPAVENILASGADVRLGIVGGAAGLYTKEGGPRVIDLPSFPELYKPEAESHIAVLERLRNSESALDWFYLSPTASFGSHAPEVEPKGTYRTELDTLVVDSEGNSLIAGEDYAIAFVDEIENPQHSRQRFSVGY